MRHGMTYVDVFRSQFVGLLVRLLCPFVFRWLAYSCRQGGVVVPSPFPPPPPPPPFCQARLPDDIAESGHGNGGQFGGHRHRTSPDRRGRTAPDRQRRPTTRTSGAPSNPSG